MLRRLLWRHGGVQLALAARIAELPLRRLVGAVVRRVPRDPALCVFGAARDRFGDNSAYLYIHLSANLARHRCVWITGSPRLRDRLRAAGLHAETRWSRQGILAAARAGWYVVSSYTSDVNRWLADGATVLNTWHGVPLKRIERDIQAGPLRLIYADREPIRSAFAERTRPPDLLLAPSRFIAERCFTSAFRILPERCLPFGYPRTDHFSGPLAAPPHPLLVRDPARWHELRARGPVVGYFPTWRDSDVGRATPYGLDLAALAEGLRELGAVLVFKPHIVAVAPPPVEGVTTLDPEDDADAFLPLCDVLVTDYSSLAFDYMLLRRPIVYFVPDLDEYAGYRGFYFDPMEMMPGAHVRDSGELLPSIAAALRSAPDERLEKVRDLVWDGYAGDACARLAEVIAAEPIV